MTALALVGVRVWDGLAGARDERPCVLRIEGGRIAAIGPDAALAEGAEVRRLAGATALPGLIDAHVHLTLDPEIRDPADQLRVPEAEVRRAAARRALEAARAGVTTLRDLGGGAGIEIDLRERVARGELVGPRILCAGQPLTSRGGHCHFWGGEVETREEIAECVRRQVERGTDWIKVMATGGVMTRGTRIAEAQFDAAALTAVVEEARARGRPVAAHCHGTAGIRNAVEAGVATVEHCSWAGEKGFGRDVDPRLAERMAERGIAASPTVNSGWRRLLERDGRATRFARGMRAGFDALRRAGAALIASTDAGIPGVTHGDLPRALPVFGRVAGLSPLEALRCATSGSARVLGLAGETGALRPGLAADVLVVQGNPLEDLETLANPLLVLARGSVLTEA